MKKLRNSLNKYMPFFHAGLKSTLAYKATIYGWLVIGLVEILFIFFLYSAVYHNSPQGLNSIINGFTFYEIILYTSTSFVFGNAINSDTTWNIFVEVRDGTIVNTLTKPVSYRLRHLFTCFGQSFFQTFFVSFPLLIILYGLFIGLGYVNYTALSLVINVLFFLIFLILATLIKDSIAYLVGILTFYTQHMFGLNVLMSSIISFLSGSLVPLSYMGTFGVVFSYLPFSFLNSTPILVLMGKVQFKNILIFLAIALVYEVALEVLNHYFFSHCMKKLVVQGG